MKLIGIDGREFKGGMKTGICRFLEGLFIAVAKSKPDIGIMLASCGEDVIPDKIRNLKNIKIKKISNSFFQSERQLSKVSKNISLFISPYPKLPLFGCYCPTINTVHDVLDLTHPAYKKRIKVPFDKYRLKMALKKADLTWYVSKCSLKETKNLIGSAGRNPKVRYNAIDEYFSPEKQVGDEKVINSYGLKKGYILVLGNGLPHKNLGTLLKISHQLKRLLVFAGVSLIRQAYWKSQYPSSNAIWIEHISDQDLPVILREAFCLAQPSTAEGYGYPPLEAMACGIPAVVSNIPSLAETTGENALLADPNRPSEWLEALQNLESDVYYEKITRSASNWVEKFKGPSAWKKHINDIENVIASDTQRLSKKRVSKAT